MANYEIVALLRPDLEEEAINAAIARVHQRITEHGGSVTNTDRWGKRRLAYAIQKYRDGFYVLSVFSLESGQVARLRQTLGLHEDLLRFVVAEHHPAPVRAAAPAAAAPAPAPAAAPAPSPAPAAPAPAPAAPAPAAPAPSGGDSPATGAEGADV
ncbi:MAG: 30S ribosomal protein S6 [bacterium]